MSNKIRSYEVKVEVKQRGSRHFSSHVGRYIEDTISKTFHIKAKSPKQAKHKAEKHGRVVRCQKVSAPQFIERMAIISEAQLANLQMINPYPDAIAMDEFVWKKKGKRAERIRNNGRGH